MRDLAPAVAPPPRNCSVSVAIVRASGLAMPLIRDPPVAELVDPGVTVDGSARRAENFVRLEFL